MKQRRVGTITLGLSLIMIGILIPVSLFNKEYASMIMKLSPLILVALGIEVLIYSFWFKNEKLSYDGMSVFLAVVVTICTVAAASIAPLVDKANSWRKIHTSIEAEMDVQLRKTMREMDIRGDAGIYLNSADFLQFFNNEPTAEQLNLTVEFNLQYPNVDITNILDRSKIADDIVKLTKSLASEAHVDRIKFLVDVDKDESIYISLRQGEFEDITSSDIEEQINFRIFNDTTRSDIESQTDLENIESEEYTDF